MSGLPDFTTMTESEIADWFINNDTSELMKLAKPLPEGTRFVQVDEHDRPLNRVVTVKMSDQIVDRLDQRAGRDREGRSGIIRQAVEEWFERHAEDAA